MTEAVAIVESISMEEVATLNLVLLAFGTGMGFSVVSPLSNSEVSGSTLDKDI